MAKQTSALGAYEELRRIKAFQAILVCALYDVPNKWPIKSLIDPTIPT